MNFVLFLSEQNKKEKYQRDKTHKQKIKNCRGGGGQLKKETKQKMGPGERKQSDESLVSFVWIELYYRIIKKSMTYTAFNIISDTNRYIRVRAIWNSYPH